MIGMIALGAIAAATVVGGIYYNQKGKGVAKAEEAEGEGKGEFWAGLDDKLPMIIGVIGICVTVAIAIVMYFKQKE